MNPNTPYTNIHQQSGVSDQDFNRYNKRRNASETLRNVGLGVGVVGAVAHSVANTTAGKVLRHPLLSWTSWGKKATNVARVGKAGLIGGAAALAGSALANYSASNIDPEKQGRGALGKIRGDFMRSTSRLERYRQKYNDPNVPHVLLSEHMAHPYPTAHNKMASVSFEELYDDYKRRWL